MLEDGIDLSVHEEIIEDQISHVQFIGEIPFTADDMDLLQKSIAGTIKDEIDLFETCHQYPVSIACFLISKAISSPDIDTFWSYVFSEIHIERTPKTQELLIQTFLQVLNQTDNLFSDYHPEDEDFFFLLGLHCLIQKDSCHDLENLVSNIKKGIQSPQDSTVRELLAPERTRVRQEEVAQLDDLVQNSHNTEDFEIFLKKLAVIALFNKEKEVSQTAYTLLHKIYSSISDDEIGVSSEIEHGLALIFEREEADTSVIHLSEHVNTNYERILQEQNKIPALLTDILVDQKGNFLNQYRELIQEIKSELFVEIQENLKETLYSINEARIKTQYQIETNKTKIVTDITQCIDSAKTLEKANNEIELSIEQKTDEIREYVQNIGSEIRTDILSRQGDSTSISDSFDNLIHVLNPSISGILTEIRQNNADTLDLLQIVEDKTRNAIEASEQTIISDIGNHLQALDSSVYASQSDIVAEIVEKNTVTNNLLLDLKDTNVNTLEEITQAVQAGIVDQKDFHHSLGTVLTEVGNDVLRTKEDMLTVLQEVGNLTQTKVDESEMHILSEIQDHIAMLSSSFSTSNSELLSEFQQSNGNTHDLLRNIENRALSRITESEIATTEKIESRVCELSESLDTAKFYIGSKILQNKDDMLDILKEVQGITQQKIENSQTTVIGEVQNQVQSLGESLQMSQLAIKADIAENSHDIVNEIHKVDLNRDIRIEDVETTIVQEIHLQNSLLHEFKDVSLNVIEDVNGKLVDSALIIEEMKNFQSKFTTDFSQKIDGIVSQLQEITSTKILEQKNEVVELKHKALLFVREDAISEAITLYYDIIHKYPDDIDSRIFLAYMVIKSGSYDEGIRIIETELKEGFESDLLDFWYTYAQYKIRKINQMPYETEPVFQDAKKKYQGKKYEEALSQLQSIETYHSNDPRYAIYRAFCLLKAGDLREALIWVTRCRELDPIDKKVQELESMLITKTSG